MIFFTLKNLGLEVHTVIRDLSECILLFCHIFLLDYNCIYIDSHVHKTQTNSYFGTFCPMIRCRLYRIQKTKHCLNKHFFLINFTKRLS